MRVPACRLTPASQSKPSLLQRVFKTPTATDSTTALTSEPPAEKGPEKSFLHRAKDSLSSGPAQRAREIREARGLEYKWEPSGNLGTSAHRPGMVGFESAITGGDALWAFVPGGAHSGYGAGGRDSGGGAGKGN